MDNSVPHNSLPKWMEKVESLGGAWRTPGPIGCHLRLQGLARGGLVPIS